MGASTSKCEEAAEPVAEPEPAAEPEEEPEKEIKLGTTPFDPRFPCTNQAKHCYVRYNEFHKCVAERGEATDPVCVKKAAYYRSICPDEWLEKWDEQRDNGTWPGRW